MSMESRIAHRWARSEKTARYLTLTFHTDPGHGWLEVPIAMLKELGIHKDISPYSYRRGQNAYLEEDVDAGKFMRAAKEAGWNIRYREQHKNNSPIRDYRGFRSASEKTARLLKRHIKILDKFLDGGYGPKFRGFETVLWDDLPPRVRADLERVKNTETLWSDAERYISDKLYNRARMWSRSSSEKIAAKTDEETGYDVSSEEWVLTLGDAIAKANPRLPGRVEVDKGSMRGALELSHPEYGVFMYATPFISNSGRSGISFLMDSDSPWDPSDNWDHRIKWTGDIRKDVATWTKQVSKDLRDILKQTPKQGSVKTAKAKNKRVFIDYRRDTLILDFRGDSGMRALDPKKLQNLYRDFFIDVVNLEKKVGLISTSRGHSAIEVYQGELGFHIQRWYKVRDIMQLPIFHERYDGLDEKVQVENAIADALVAAGWGAHK